MTSVKESRGLHEPLREPNLVWRFRKSSLRKWRFRWAPKGSGREELGAGPILGRGDSVFKREAEGQGGWREATQKGCTDEYGPDRKGLEVLEKDPSLCPKSNWEVT